MVTASTSFLQDLKFKLWFNGKMYIVFKRYKQADIGYLIFIVVCFYLSDVALTSCWQPSGQGCFIQHPDGFVID